MACAAGSPMLGIACRIFWVSVPNSSKSRTCFKLFIRLYPRLSVWNHPSAIGLRPSCSNTDPQNAPKIEAPKLRRKTRWRRLRWADCWKHPSSLEKHGTMGEPWVNHGWTIVNLSSFLLSLRYLYWFSFICTCTNHVLPSFSLGFPWLSACSKHPIYHIVHSCLSLYTWSHGIDLKPHLSVRPAVIKFVFCLWYDSNFWWKVEFATDSWRTCPKTPENKLAKDLFVGQSGR